MKAKDSPVTSRRQRKATTYRLDPHIQKGLALIGQIQNKSLNRMVNEAVGEYLESRAASVEAGLEETLHRIRLYRKADPNFEAAISKFAEAEAALAGEDPVEGKTASAPSPRSAQMLVRDLISG
jgi:hypothetical protein